MKDKIKENLKDKISNKLLGKEKEAEYKGKKIINRLMGVVSKVASNIRKVSSKIKNAYNRKNVSQREFFSCSSLTLIYSFCFFSILSLFVNCKANPNLAQKEQNINETEQYEVNQNNFNNNDSIQNKPIQSDLDKTIELYDNFEKTTLENQSTKIPYKTALIYVTERTYDGKFGPYFNIGGVKAADAACNDRNEINKSNSRSYYKALIGIPGEREICNTPFCINDSFTKENPLQPNTAYFRINSIKLIGRTSNQGIFLKPLVNSFAGGEKKYYWTGLTLDWLIENEKNCNGFNANDVEHAGRVSDTTKKQFNNSEESAISSVDLNCSTRNSIVCVEQHD